MSDSESGSSSENEQDIVNQTNQEFDNGSDGEKSQSSSAASSDSSQSGDEKGSGSAYSKSGSSSGSGSSSSSNNGSKSSSSSSGSNSESEDSSRVKQVTKRKKRSSKDSTDIKTYWEDDPDMYGIRRSSREKKQPERMTIERKTRNQRKNSNQWHSSDSHSEYVSNSDSSECYRKRQKRPPRRRKRIKESDSNDSQTDQKSRVSRAIGSVSYKESSTSSAGSEGEDDLIAGSNVGESEEASHSIDKVLMHRFGKKGATGMQTYIYEVETKGDPNTDFDPSDESQIEMQFWIKWKSWSHLHNTWESYESLKTQEIKGMKKIENYLQKDDTTNAKKKKLSPEDLEYFNIESEQEKACLASHIEAKRIFFVAEEDGVTYYYILWNNLPYSEATWENEVLTTSRFQEQLQVFMDRENSTSYPKDCNAILRHRPKFSVLKEQPTYLGGGDESLKLRDYQLDGLNWLVHAWSKHNSVILADEMGLGKTIQAISFLSYLFHSHSINGPFLFVLPLSTVPSWEREFQRWAPDMNTVVYMGDRNSRKTIQDYEWRFPSGGIKFNCLLTTYEIVLRDKDVLQSVGNWTCLIVDEAHRLKNEEAQLYTALKEFKTNHRILITGTPLQNSLRELWALLHFIMPDKFDDCAYFESHYNEEKIKNGIHQLHKQLEPYILRRVKKNVEKSLPAKVEQILRVDMTKKQKEYYKYILTRNHEQLRKGNKGSRSSLINIVMELKKCSNHATLTKEEEQPDPDLLQQLIKGSGKLVLLDKLLTRLRETGNRVLIFSQMVLMLDILGLYLQLRRFPFQRLDGTINAEKRKQALDHFNADNSQDFCFLLSTRAGGLGINLATANVVIIYDSDWNPQNDLQAQARAHRIGQTKQVYIYRFVTKHSIEESILRKAKEKMVLDHLVIQSMDTTGKRVFNKKMPNSSSQVPFNKTELDAILKFGAEKLFDDDENDGEATCDIDEILRMAEKRDEETTTASDQFFASFKTANFNLEDVNEKEWDDIIPESIRIKVTEDEKLKEMEQLYLLPRNRSANNNLNARKKGCKRSRSSDSDEPSSTRPRKRGRPRVYEKETVKGFTDAEVRRFYKSLKKFSNPLRRVEIIAKDAMINEKSPEQFEDLCKTIIDRCKEEMLELEKQSKMVDKENEKDADYMEGSTKKRERCHSFKLSNVAINAKTTLAAIEELMPLDAVIPHSAVERASWTVPLKRVKDAHYEVPWGKSEDSRLLRGIYEYGMGSWEQIKADPSLSLGDKIILPNNQKPQKNHLESRVQYLLKMFAKCHIVKKTPTTTQRSRKPKAKEIKSVKEIEQDDSSDEEKMSQVAVSNVKSSKEAVKETADNKIKDVVEEDTSKKMKRSEKSVSPAKCARLSHVKINGKYVDHDTDMTEEEHPLWKICKEKMTPIKKILKSLDVRIPDQPRREELKHTKSSMLLIGDHIERDLTQYRDKHIYSDWKSFLWRFVAQFTDKDGRSLYKLYKRIKDKKKKNSGKDKEESKKEEKKSLNGSSENSQRHHHEKKKKDKPDRERDKEKSEKKHKDKEKNKEDREKEKRANRSERHGNKGEKRVKKSDNEKEKHVNREYGSQDNSYHRENWDKQNEYSRTHSEYNNEYGRNTYNNYNEYSRNRNDSYNNSRYPNDYNRDQNYQGYNRDHKTYYNNQYDSQDNRNRSNYHGSYSYNSYNRPNRPSHHPYNSQQQNRNDPRHWNRNNNRGHPT